MTRDIVFAQSIRTDVGTATQAAGVSEAQYALY